MSHSDETIPPSSDSRKEPLHGSKWMTDPRYTFTASDDHKAAGLFETFRHRDPWPNIAPALLNSADIAEYVAETGMICPFEPSLLKPATYTFKLLGLYIFWDENGVPISKTLMEGEEFHLEPRTIAFVTLEPMLRLPDYIVARFNLRIDHVYRGLLLGTGPIVDPGYQGRLSLPLHNLTNNRYTLKGGEKLIRMEFTKLSQNVWSHGPESQAKRIAGYVPFGERPMIALPDLIKESLPLGTSSVQSSIGTALIIATRNAEQAKKDAKAAEEHASSLMKEAAKYSYWTLMGALVGVVGLWFTAWRDATSYVDKARQDLKEERAHRDQLVEKLILMNSLMDGLKIDLSKLQSESRLAPTGQTNPREQSSVTSVPQSPTPPSSPQKKAP